MIHLMALAQSCPREWTNPRDRMVPGYKDVDEWIALAKTLERGKFDALFFADSTGGVVESYRGDWREAAKWGVRYPQNDNLLLLAALAAATENLGLAATLSVTYHAPYNAAVQFSTLDHLTKGRVGWNVVTSYNPAASRNGLGEWREHDDRYEVAEEFMEVVYKLWEHSFDEDAILADREGRVYADTDKIRKINHVGEHYSVEGPHMCEPSAQRTPVLLQAGSSPRGLKFGTKHAEVLFTASPNIARAKELTGRVHDGAVAAGRDPRDVKIIQGVMVFVAETTEEAEEKQRCAVEAKAVDASLTMFGAWTGIDASKYPLEKPLSEFDTNFSQGILASFTESRDDGDATLGDVAEWMSAGDPAPRIVGTPKQVVDELEAWARDGGVDGFMLIPYTTPGSMDDFVDLVVPELQARGLVRSEYEGSTFRENLFGGDGRSRLPESHPARKVVLEK